MTDDRPDLLGPLSHELGRHARSLHLIKSYLAQFAPAGLDMAAFGLLVQLTRCGPSRQGDLADRALLDPSTVSRYVAQLVRHGYLERRPDPADGRAVLLVATDHGEAATAEVVRLRTAVMRDVLAEWTDDDVTTLTTLLGRLNDEVEARRPSFTAGSTRPGTAPVAAVTTSEES